VIREDETMSAMTIGSWPLVRVWGFLATIACIWGDPAEAQMHKCRGPDGAITFQQTPCAGAQRSEKVPDYAKRQADVGASPARQSSGLSLTAPQSHTSTLVGQPTSPNERWLPWRDTSGPAQDAGTATTVEIMQCAGVERQLNDSTRCVAIRKAYTAFQREQAREEARAAAERQAADAAARGFRPHEYEARDAKTGMPLPHAVVVGPDTVFDPQTGQHLYGGRDVTIERKPEHRAAPTPRNSDAPPPRKVTTCADLEAKRHRGSYEQRQRADDAYWACTNHSPR
jgi:hypothetical protein